MYMSAMMAELLDYMKISVEEVYNEDEYDTLSKLSEECDYTTELRYADNTESR